MGIFSSCIQYVLDNEGGYSNNRLDSGGPTNFGITKNDFSRWIGHSASITEIQQMSLKIAEQIYFKWYWTPLGLDRIDSNPVCTCILDTGVNEGLHEAIILAQTTITTMGGSLTIDGQIGPLTEAAINKTDPGAFIQIYADLVTNRYNEIVAKNPSQEVFLKGWLNRADRLLTLAPA